MDIADLTPAQKALLRTVYDGFREAGEWPVFAWVDARLDRDHEIDAEETLSDMPDGYVNRDRGAGQHATIRLTMAGTAQVAEAQEDCEHFVRLVRWLAEQERSHDPGSPTNPKPVDVSLEEVIAGAWEGNAPDGNGTNRILILLQAEGLAVGRNESVETDGEEKTRFVLEADRRIRPYRGLESIEDYVRRRPAPASSNRFAVNTDLITNWGGTTFSPTYLQFGDAVTSEPDVSGTYLFILMPFAPSWSQNIKDVIDQACERLQAKYEDLQWERADDMTNSGRITDQIITAIERADLVIADVTDSNPNVMFELGYAAALDRPIVLLNQGVEETPFDIKDWRQVVYSLDMLAEARNELVRHLDANLHRIRERVEA